MDYKKEYLRWCERALADEDVTRELAAIAGDEAKIEDAFYRDLAFGTGGLRGVIGAGTNRMNVYTVAKASQGLADYVVKQFAPEDRKIAVSYDSRIKSELFSKTAAGVFAANGIAVFLYPELMPTPCLSWAVRALGCAAGIMITASHNPSKYNGYKVYGADGCQITTEAAAEILAEIEKLDVFEDVKQVPYHVSGKEDAQYGTADAAEEQAQGSASDGAACSGQSSRADARGNVPQSGSVNAAEEQAQGSAPDGVTVCGGPSPTGARPYTAGVGTISYIPAAVYTAFVEEVKNQSVLFGEEINKDVLIVYSPLNGTGRAPVLRTLKESGFNNITVVAEQELPDGNFPTCPYPNPEIHEAMSLGMEYAKKNNAELLLATDPDCDRVGIAVKNEAGEYVLLSGNETGMLLLDYICSQRSRHGKMPADPVLVKTIVTIDMAERIAADYGVRTINVLTGFKFIGEQIGLLERAGRADSYIFGFEESYGYLSGSYVRDKDAVNGAFLICEMFAYYKTRGISLTQKLHELYAKYGFCLNTLHSYQFEGSAGFAKMQEIMKSFRGGITAFAGKKVVTCLDYSEGLDGLPKSDVLKFLLEDNCSVVVRPSGTEPKLKTYISVSAENKEMAAVLEKEIAEELADYFL